MEREDFHRRETTLLARDVFKWRSKNYNGERLLCPEIYYFIGEKQLFLGRIYFFGAIFQSKKIPDVFFLLNYKLTYYRYLLNKITIIPLHKFFFEYEMNEKKYYTLIVLLHTILRILKKEMNNSEDTYNLFPKMKLTTQI